MRSTEYRRFLDQLEEKINEANSRLELGDADATITMTLDGYAEEGDDDDGAYWFINLENAHDRATAARQAAKEYAEIVEWAYDNGGGGDSYTDIEHDEETNGQRKAREALLELLSTYLIDRTAEIEEEETQRRFQDHAQDMLGQLDYPERKDGWLQLDRGTVREIQDAMNEQIALAGRRETKHDGLARINIEDGGMNDNHTTAAVGISATLPEDEAGVEKRIREIKKAAELQKIYNTAKIEQTYNL